MLDLPPTPPTTAASLGSAWAIVAALFRGRLRPQFYADIVHLGATPEAPRRVAAGYVCLAASIGWALATLGTLLLNPPHVEAHVLGVINAIANAIGFMMLRARKDPRIALDWLLALTLVSIAVISLDHSGVLAPILFTLPTLVGVSALYQRPRMRIWTLAVGVVVGAICLSAAMGVIGTPTTYGPRIYFVAVFIVLLSSTMGLGGLAWLSMMARDYMLEQVRATNDAIVDSAARARVALEAARVGLWDVPNTDQRRFHISESFQAVTGYTGEEFDAIFGNAARFVHPDDVESLTAAFAAGRERLTRIRIDFRLLTKTRGYRWFTARARYSQNPDGSLRISGSLQDINFIKAAEDALRAGRDQARAANKAKSDFIAVMSHEVRTPLNAILGSVDMLKRGVHDRQAQEMVDLIDEAGRGLLAIVNDLLDVSRIDAGKLEIALAPTDLTALVRRSVEFWGPQASDKGLVLAVDCSEAAQAPLMIDAGRVRQIVGNLISNAIKFTATGAITTRLSTHPTPDGRVQVTISVIDTGPGVADSVAETIFAPFEQAPGDASRGGAGLGLFISRRLARMMGGDLTLEPARRSGAHFRLTLVAERADAAKAEEDGGEERPVGLGGLHLLVVDDNENNRRIAELLLGKLGFKVTLAASGAEAIDLCAMQVFDLILLDIVMPEMDGPQTLAQLRGDDDSLNRATPAVALTAKLSPADLAAYLAAGFEGVSGKPIDLAALAREISRIVAARRAESETTAS